MNYLFFDTETNGLPKKYDAPASDINNWPRMLQIAWILTDESGNELNARSELVRVDKDLVMDEGAQAVHGHTKEKLREDGMCLNCLLIQFYNDATLADRIIAHNIQFDMGILGAEYMREGHEIAFRYINVIQKICTKEKSTKICQIPGPYGYKWPKLQELHMFLFGEEFEGAHDAMADIRATKKCFFEMVNRNLLDV